MRIIATFMLLLVATVVTAQVRPASQAQPSKTPPSSRTPAAPVRAGTEPAQARTAAPAKPAGTTPADAGAALYRKNGCYECHVDQAQGGPQGPRLGPNPVPMARFMTYVRNPTGDMPPFTAKVISDQDLASIYAFLQSRPVPPPVKDIPLLAP